MLRDNIKLTLMNILTTDVAGRGVPLASIYLQDSRMDTIYHALSWFNNMASVILKRAYSPDRVMADDAPAVRTVIDVLWPHAQVLRLHVCCNASGGTHSAQYILYLCRLFLVTLVC